MKNSHIILAVILILGAILMPGCNAGHDTAQAKNGNTVQVNYTLKLADGTVFETSVGSEPLEFTLGAGQMIPGFEKAVLGMKVGEKKTVTIPSDEAYGPRRDDLVSEIPRKDFTSGPTPEVGLQWPIVQEGRLIVVTITKVTDAAVTIDANPPLAGKDLTFEIKLLEIK